MKVITTKGIILKEYTVGESDKFISIFTKSNGKLMVNAPYAKKHNRGFASGTQLFVYGQFVLQEYKGNYKLLQVDIIEAFHPLRNDLIRLSYSAYILEVIDATMEEYLYSPNTLRLIVRTFQAMCKDTIRPDLIRYIFELKHMCMSGFMPSLLTCNGCGISYDEITTLYFDIAQGGLVCKSCSTPNPHRYEISQGTLHAMQYIVSVHIDELFMFEVSEKVLRELKKVMGAYISYYIDKEFKTLKFLEEITDTKL